MNNFTIFHLNIINFHSSSIAQVCKHKVMYHADHISLLTGLCLRLDLLNLFCLFAKNKGADQRGHPGSLILVFPVHCIGNIILLTSMP